MSTKLATALVEIKTSGLPALKSDLNQTQSLLTRAFSGIATSASGLLAGFGIQAIVSEMAQFGAASIKLASDAETVNTAFKVLVGSAEGAQKVLAELRKFAAETPFEFPELAEAGKKLLAFGVAADDIVPMLRRIGDISAGIGAPISEIAELFGKAKVQGRLFAEDINQLTGRGIPIIQELAKQFGVTDGEVKKLVESGQVGFENLERAFIDLTNEGGKFGGMMAEMSKTTGGLWSTMQDAINEVKRAIGELIIEGGDVKGLLQEIAAFAEDFGDALEEVGPDLKQSLAESAKSISSIAESLTGATDRTEQLTIALEALNVVLEQIAAGFKLLEQFQEFMNQNPMALVPPPLRPLAEAANMARKGLKPKEKPAEAKAEEAPEETKGPGQGDSAASQRPLTKQDWDAVRENRTAKVKDPFANFLEDEKERSDKAAKDAKDMLDDMRENRMAEVKPPMAPDDVEELAEALGMNAEAIRDMFGEQMEAVGGKGFTAFADLSRKTQEAFLSHSSPQEKLVKLAEQQNKIAEQEKAIQQAAKEALDSINDKLNFGVA